jgi:hypothetical protein
MKRCHSIYEINQSVPHLTQKNDFKKEQKSLELLNDKYYHRFWISLINIQQAIRPLSMLESLIFVWKIRSARTKMGFFIQMEKFKWIGFSSR